MTLKYHGLVVYTPESGQLRFGIEPLIGSCQSWVWKFEKDLPAEIQDSFKRFDNRTYWQCAKKCKDTVHKINKISSKLNKCKRADCSRGFPALVGHGTGYAKHQCKEKGR